MGSDWARKVDSGRLDRQPQQHTKLIALLRSLPRLYGRLPVPICLVMLAWASTSVVVLCRSDELLQVVLELIRHYEGDPRS